MKLRTSLNNLRKDMVKAILASEIWTSTHARVIALSKKNSMVGMAIALVVITLFLREWADFEAADFIKSFIVATALLFTFIVFVDVPVAATKPRKKIRPIYLGLLLLGTYLLLGFGYSWVNGEQEELAASRAKEENRALNRLIHDRIQVWQLETAAFKGVLKPVSRDLRRPPAE